MSIERALETYQSHFRFEPDRRFLSAFRAVTLLASGQPGTAEASWTGSGWQIKAEGVPVAEVSALPSFDELFSALLTHARRSLMTGGVTRGRPVSATQWSRDEYFPERAIVALDRLGVSWSATRSPEVAQRAARLLAGLAFQVECVSSLPLQEPLAARALAALAVARALDSESGRSEESLVSYLLGYSAHAADLARSAPPDDAVAAYLLRRDDVLDRLASAPDASPEVRYLHVRALVRRGPAGEWRQALEAWRIEPSDLAVVLAPVLRGSFDEERSMPPALLGMWASHWLEQRPPEKEWFQWVIARAGDVDAAIETHANRWSGPFVDREVALSVYAAHYYAALRTALDFQLYSRSSVEGAQSVLDAIPRSESARIVDLRRFYATRIDWERGAIDDERRHAILTLPGPLTDARDRAQMLGAHGESSANSPDARTRNGAFTMLDGLDSRPEHRLRAIEVAGRRLRDPLRADWLEVSLARDDAPRQPLTRAAIGVRRARVDDVLNDIASGTLPAQDLNGMARALIDRDCMEATRLKDGLANAWRQPKYRHWVFPVYASVLEDCTREFALVEKLAREFIADPSSDAGLTRPHAMADLALALRRQGRAGEAWALLEPEVPGQVGSVLSQAALALMDLGRFGEAEALALEALDRYPGDHFRAYLARIRWQAGRPDDAARAVTGPDAKLSARAFATQVGEQFWWAFEDGSRELTLKAFDVLVRHDAQRGTAGRTTEIAARFEKENQHELAFEMYSRLARLNSAVIKDPEAVPLYEPAEAVFTRDKWRAAELAGAWRNLRALRGDEAARKWIRELRPDGYPWDLAPHLFKAGAYELLWDAFPQAQPGEYVWLLRATAVALRPELAKIHGATLHEYFEDRAQRQDHFLGRVTLGLESADELLRLELGPNERCMLAFHLGVAAEARGDRARALDLYEVALDADTPTYNAYGYSRLRLDAWRKADIAFDAPARTPVSPKVALR
ncbi:MAG: hypothetical protein WEF50_11280 [Myxococcota bacterium]